MDELRSPREIELMRRTGLVVWQALQLAAGRVRPGVTTAEIDQTVERWFAEQGATPLFKNYPNARRRAPAFPAVTCISVNEEVVHGIPGPRQLKEGDIVSIDTGCKLGGWCGDAAATFPVGQVSDEDRRLLDTTRGVLALAIDMMGKRRWWHEVAAEMQRYVKRQGFSVVESLVGHGIGRNMHEGPNVPNYPGGDDFRLEPGLVIAIEPMVNAGVKDVRTAKDHWTEVTSDGRRSAHFEHTVALTATGPVILTAGANGETW